MDDLDRRMLEMQAKNLRMSVRESVEGIVFALRNTADKIEREASDATAKRRLEAGIDPHDGAGIAEFVQHEVLWMLANLGLDRLTHYGARLDKAEAELEAAQD